MTARNTHSSITTGFFTHGNAGIGVAAKAERRAAEAAQARALADGATPRATGALRQRLGTWLIATGESVLGRYAPVAGKPGLNG
jgi:hypothetical protein